MWLCGTMISCASTPGLGVGSLYASWCLFWWSHILPFHSPPSPMQIPIPSVPTLQPSTLIPERLEAIQRYIRELQYPFYLWLKHQEMKWGWREKEPDDFPADFWQPGVSVRLGNGKCSFPKRSSCFVTADSFAVLGWLAGFSVFIHSSSQHPACDWDNVSLSQALSPAQ